MHVKMGKLLEQRNICSWGRIRSNALYSGTVKLRQFSFTVALTGSLALHAMLMAWALRAATPLRWPGWNAQERLARLNEELSPVYQSAPPEVALSTSEFGKSDGRGRGNNEIEANELQLAREAPEEQAFLSRDPAGDGNIGSSGEGLSAPPAEQVVAPVIRQHTLLVPAREHEAEPEPTTVPVTLVVNASSSPYPSAAADPAPMSESESDPFMKTGSVEFRAGKVDAQFGRKVKTTRPKLTLAGRYDLVAKGGASLQLKVRIDPNGNVTHVDILRSSGSNEIDQPCRVAVYEWWFEPTRSSNGQAVADVIVFSITWR
jgi:TonB family protein